MDFASLDGQDRKAVTRVAVDTRDDFKPDAVVTLPSGRVISGADMQSMIDHLTNGVRAADAPRLRLGGHYTL